MAEVVPGVGEEPQLSPDFFQRGRVVVVAHVGAEERVGGDEVVGPVGVARVGGGEADGGVGGEDQFGAGVADGVGLESEEPCQ